MTDSDRERMIPDRDVKRTTDDPTKYPLRTTRVPDEDTQKRSRYCKHGNVWGRCPHGC